MENISTVIKALFEKVDGDEVLKKTGYGAEKDNDPCRMDSDMIESVIVNKLLQVDKESTIDQVSMLEQIVQFKWMEPDDSCMSLIFRRKSSVFNILLYFSTKCLRVKDGEPLLPQSLEHGPGLLLEAVEAGDAGTYSCVAMSEAGEARRHFQLMVMGESPAPSASFSGLGVAGGPQGVGERWRR